MTSCLQTISLPWIYFLPLFLVSSTATVPEEFGFQMATGSTPPDVHPPFTAKHYRQNFIVLRQKCKRRLLQTDGTTFVVPHGLPHAEQ